MSRQDQYEVTAVIDGVTIGPFENLTGGEVDSEETTYRLGAMGPRVSLGGAVNPGNLTLSILYDLNRVHTLVHWLMTRVGKGSGTVTKQPLDVDRNAFGRPITYPVRLKQVNPPEYDANGSDAAQLELEFTVDGTVT